MGYLRPLFGCGFGGADIHAAIDLHGIGVDYLAVQPAGQIQGQFALARGGRAADDEDPGFHVRLKIFSNSASVMTWETGRPWGQLAAKSVSSMLRSSSAIWRDSSGWTPRTTE